MTPLFAFISVPTMIVLGVIAVLIFGRRLPEIAKSLGKSITEFKKGAHGLENGFDDIVSPQSSPAPAASAPAEAIRPPQRVAPAAPKFDDVPPMQASAPAPHNVHGIANPPQP